MSCNFVEFCARFLIP